MKHTRSRMHTGRSLPAVLFCVILQVCAGLAQTSETPVNFKMAFIGDQGLGAEARAVITLIKTEGAQAVLHLGDFDYEDDPAAWEAQINDILGANFPYFACIGNHDEDKWHGVDGYQRYLQDRLNRLGISWEGNLGVKSALRYNGIFIVLAAPGILDSGHEIYIRDRLAADNSTWSIAGWHKNMRLMQAGGKSDETGWEVYEEARKGGAIIATAHEHSYSRSHLLSSIINQTVASRGDTLVLSKGETFVFVSGLGGRSIRDQELSGNWWASIHTSEQEVTYGALFGVFNVNGIQRLANFYFKDIAGRILDRFAVISNVEGDTLISTPGAEAGSDFVLEQNHPNPLQEGIPSTTIRFHLPKSAHVQVTVLNLLGEPVRVLMKGELPAGGYRMPWDGRDETGHRLPSGTYWYRLQSEDRVLTKKLLLLK